MFEIKDWGGKRLDWDLVCSRDNHKATFARSIGEPQVSLDFWTGWQGHVLAKPLPSGFWFYRPSWNWLEAHWTMDRNKIKERFLTAPFLSNSSNRNESFVNASDLGKKPNENEVLSGTKLLSGSGIPSIEDTSNIFVRATYSYLNPLLRVGYKVCHDDLGCIRIV